eukprot:556384_1
MGSNVSKLPKPTKHIEYDVNEQPKLLLYGYIEQSSKRYGLLIPDDIIRLCLLFYQTNFEWTIDTEENRNKSLYNSVFEIESNDKNIIARIGAKLDINAATEMCILSIQAWNFRSIIPPNSNLSNRHSVYCHVHCKELDYEWKFTTPINWCLPAICSFPTMPKGSVTMDCYFKMLTKVANMPIQGNYLWNLDPFILDQIYNGKHRRFYSAQFHNDCLCLSILNEKFYDQKYRKLSICIHLSNSLNVNKTIDEDENANYIEPKLIHECKNIEGKVDVETNYKKKKKYGVTFVQSLTLNCCDELIGLTMEKENTLKSIEITFKLS